MPFKASGSATEWQEIDRWTGGVGWIAHPEETMQRASHALTVDGDVWVIDPVDATGIDDLLAEFGTVKGVVVLLDRHQRDAETVARRHDVPVYVPSFIDRRFSVPVEPIDDELAETGYRVIRVVDWPGWREAALFDGETLVLADVLGTVAYFTVPGEPIGVHPMLRIAPPRRLRDYRPERILVGHGTGISSEATPALNRALKTARRNLPRVWIRGLKTILP